jgi:pyruvate,water dikinase
MKQALLYTRLRHIALQLADRLVERKQLMNRDDIFMLSTDEVFSLVERNDASADSVAERVESRRCEMAAFATLQPPDRLVLGEGERWRPKEDSAMPKDAGTRSAELRGTGACGGSALGDAAVVLDVAHAGRVQAGQILVTRQTDPGWATVFFLVQGLVIERGGMLSHGAIIAREYGIPAVVGVTDATLVIRDGERLRVDGDQGIVEFAHR